MEFNHKYSGTSKVQNGVSSTNMDFSPDVLREPTYFVGSLNQHIPFREAMSALHDVVVADFNFQPKDNTQYLEWLKSQEEIWLAEAQDSLTDVDKKIAEVKRNLAQVRADSNNITGKFYKSRRKYFNYLLKRDYAAWYVLDPVITVHPDQLFFECFSKDESVYGKLSCCYEVFNDISDFECGTTNIDYSEALYQEFQKIRSYKKTEFKIDPKGFDVQTTGENSYKEIKIDLPDSWVRGFLQVSSAMTSEKISFELEATDIANFIFILKRNKERKSPRSIRYILKPGEPIVAIFEPWNIEVVCSRSIYKGDKEHEIRVWGRRRILLLERLLPITEKFTVNLLGTGMPSFYTAHLNNDLYFTLGLSGWTANDWAQVSQLNLLAPRGQVDSSTMQTIYLELRENWKMSDDELVAKTGFNKKTVNQALATFTQAGKVIYDLKNQVYRARELKREGIDIDSLRFSSELDKEAYELGNRNGAVTNIETNKTNDKIKITGDVENDHSCTVILNQDLQITDGKCTCNEYYMNKMTKGPCVHILALRIAFETK